MAVDRFAIRSLCYRVVDDRLRCAARADDLADAGHEIEPQSIFNYLYSHNIPSPATIFKGIYRLPPGHYGLFEAGRLTVLPYWVPRFQERGEASFGSLRKEFRQLLQEAVADHMDGTQAACFLSGGTDSSTIAGMIGLASGRPAATYSIGFDAAGYDEMAFARVAARHFKTEHHEYYVSPDDLVRSIPEVAAYYDQPFGNSSALPAYCCARMAKADGVNKILGGDGGDELFGGNTRYAKQRIFDWYGTVPHPMQTAVLEPLLRASVACHLPLSRKAMSYVQQAKVPLPDRMQSYNQLLRLGLDDVLTPDFLARIDLDAISRQQRQVWDQARADSAVNRMLAYDWRYTLAESDLPKVVGTSQLAGIDVGFPMLDARLVDFSLRLPVSYKLKGLKLRWFFKEALRGFLPDEILTKKKQGFGLPFGVWAGQHAALRALAQDSLHGLSGRNLVRSEFINALLNERLAEHPGYYGEMVWILMMLEQWLQVHSPGYGK